MNKTAVNERHTGELAVDWYKTLSISQKMALKEQCKFIVGIEWSDFSVLFTPRERLTIIRTKLLLEGFLV